MSSPHPDLQRLLSAPILPTLLRLAAPNVLAMVMTVLVGIADAIHAEVTDAHPWARYADLLGPDWKAQVGPLLLAFHYSFWSN